VRIVKFAFIFVILILGWLIGWSNSAETTLSVLDFQSPSFPLFVWLFLSLFIGFILGLLSGRFLR
jgi:uncharacterized membrane protein AbrB (regulator of aidB expression)